MAIDLGPMRLSIAVAAALLCSTMQPRGALLHAQAGPPSAGVVASITATGCLERWNSDQEASATGAPPDAPPAGAHYVLTQVEGREASATAAGGGTPGKPNRDTRYLLLTKTAADFDAHLHHTVKVVGTIAPQPTEGALPSERAADPSRSETNLPNGPERRSYRDNLIEVSSLTMVSAKCGK